jgi:uncharacterized membrane protein HdeD (DUF308 family)
MRDRTTSISRRAGWAVALRGIVAVIFGLIALSNPGAAAGLLVMVFAIFAFADALLDFVIASDKRRIGSSWGWYAVEGIVSVAAGAIALAYPQATMLALVMLVGLRAVILGCLELAAAFSWKMLESRWLLGITGAMSVIFGLLLFASPRAAGVALLWTIGIYAMVLGLMLLVLGVRIGREKGFSGAAA